LDRLDTKYFIEGPGALEEAPSVLGGVNGRGLPVLLVCDRNTREAGGEKLRGALAGAGLPFREFLLDQAPAPPQAPVEPVYERVEELRELIRGEGFFPLALGSGTINDLVKRAAFEAGVPYICAATAPSMDGYASSGAALVKGGYKITLPCTAPAGILADTDVLRGAPPEMTASGYGDLYAKLASGTDWILADRLGLDPIHREAWDLVQGELRGWVGAPEKLRDGDSGAFSGLFRGLTMSGIAIQICKDSRPASGAEHLVSHVWEMAHLSRGGLPVSHGFKVAVGTVLSVSLMEALYRYPPERISVGRALARRGTWEDREAAVRRAFPEKSAGDQVLESARSKWCGEGELAARLERLAGLLPVMGGVLRERAGSRDRVIADLRRAGCPVSPAEFGLEKGAAREALLKAQMIRRRYTVLDAAWELGLLEELAPDA
jgi:glycerol-1-phosphate dehydrogenase [NAD(P)+]